MARKKAVFDATNETPPEATRKPRGRGWLYVVPAFLALLTVTILLLLIFGGGAR